MIRVAESSHVEDPLVGVSARFSLGRARFDVPVSIEAPSELGVRPYGLRFAVDVARSRVALGPWRFCHERQIAVTDDDHAVPWYRTLVDVTMPTTGESTDGGPSTGGEEWSPDKSMDLLP